MIIGYRRAMPAKKPTTTPYRLAHLDALRGAAMVWMTLYHFCFDLNYFGWIQQDFYNNPVWTWQRSAIVSLFLFCVGWSQASSALGSHRFLWKRWLQIALCAALVSISSYVMYPKSFIYFGVLHGVCAMLLLLWLVRSTLHQPLVVAALGVLCMVLFVYPPVVLNTAPWNVLGLVTQKPITEDYVPLLPWFALVCWGYAFGLWLQARSNKKGLNITFNPLVLVPLAKLGRYSLLYYMLHQPVLLGLCYAAKALFNFG
jgi:uncharacterized membrane protein